VRQLEPHSAETLNALDNVLRHMARLDEAMTRIRRALRFQPGFAEAHVNLANALRSVGQLDAAATGYRRALECRPEFAAAHAELATTLRLQRRTVVTASKWQVRQKISNSVNRWRHYADHVGPLRSLLPE
jgi:protein O-GlcNAc transferase